MKPEDVIAEAVAEWDRDSEWDRDTEPYDFANWLLGRFDKAGFVVLDKRESGLAHGWGRAMCGDPGKYPEAAALLDKLSGKDT